MSEESQKACCEICGSLSFEPSDGLFFCLECGTQSQDVREEIAEEGAEATSFVRTLKAPSTKKKDNPTVKKTKDVTLLEKMQVILQVQCDALIKLGYDKSLKEAVKYIWSLYLKKFGYAFQDTATSQPATPSHDHPATPSHPTNSMATPPRLSRPTSLLATPSTSTNLTTPGSSRPKKRSRAECGGDSTDTPTPKRSKGSRKRGPSTTSSKGKSPAAFDEFPSDSFLFESSQDNSPEGSEEEEDDESPVAPDLIEGQDLPAPTGGVAGGSGVSGNELYMLLRAKRRQKVKYFTVKFTIGLLYLGLLYTHQKILPSDLMRLVAVNKVPYYNLHNVLPSHFITSKHSTSIYARSQMTTDKIHQWSQELYKPLSKSFPLPILPSTNPKWVCHILLERLQLPQSFYAMLDRALTAVYWPDPRKCVDHFLDTSRWKEKRLDVECMALVVCIVKIIYRLDDVYEFEQSSKAVSTAESAVSDTSDCVYVWEDWVTLFCRHKQRTLNEEVPLNARELEYVSDYQNFLDFCRLEIFPSVRPKGRPGEEGRRRRFHPEYYKQVSEVFRQHLHNLREKETREKEARERDTDRTKEELYSWDNFTPRRILLSTLLQDSDHAPWREYRATPMTSDDARVDFERQSNSMVLLLELCSDVVDTSALVLMQHVRNVEWRVIQGPLEPLIKIAAESQGQQEK